MTDNDNDTVVFRCVECNTDKKATHYCKLCDSFLCLEHTKGHERVLDSEGKVIGIDKSVIIKIPDK